MLFWRESPRWLIQRGRHAEACTELNAICRFNRCPVRLKQTQLNAICVSGVESDDSGSLKRRGKIYSIWNLFGSRQLAAYSLVMFLSALTVEMSVGVIILDVQVLSGNPFVNIALYGLLRIWTPFFIVLTEIRRGWIGRRVLFIFSQITTTLCYVIFILLLLTEKLPSMDSDDTSQAINASVGGSKFNMARTILALFGGVINSSIFFTVYKQYTIELYPTPMRAIAIGTFGVVERIGGALAPQLVAVNRLFWPGTALSVATAILLLSLVTGFLILPETQNTSMPDFCEPKTIKRGGEKFNR